MTAAPAPTAAEARDRLAKLVADALEAFQQRDGYHKAVIADLLEDFGTFLAAPLAAALAQSTARIAALEAEVKGLERALDQSWRKAVAYRFGKVCKHLVASNMLSDMEALGFEIPGALAEAVVNADDETALAFGPLSRAALQPNPGGSDA